MTRVRSRQGQPVSIDFKESGGTPIVVDTLTGRLFVMLANGQVTDCLSLAEAGGGVWDDLRFPAQGISPAGATAPPAVSKDLAGFPGTLNFSGTAINVLSGTFQMPHAWLEGSEIHPHIHWMKSVAGAGAVGWQFKYRIMPIGAVAGAWTAWLNGVSAAINGAEVTADQHYLTTFPAISMTGQLDSCMVSWQLQRLGTTDAYNSIARLLEFDVHYRKNSLGSVQEFPV